jgi:hypothetical protein
MSCFARLLSRFASSHSNSMDSIERQGMVLVKEPRECGGPVPTVARRYNINACPDSDLVGHAYVSAVMAR